jgi:hypothetical protein
VARGLRGHRPGGPGLTGTTPSSRRPG